MYGGGFATIPAYLADMFGTQFVGAIHGRLLTAWSTAGIVGPVIVNYLHDTRQAPGIAPDRLYGPIFYTLAGLLVVGFVANLLVHPVNPKWHMSEAEIAEEGRKLRETAAAGSGSYGIGKGGLDAKTVLFWLLVGIPIRWGVWITLGKALVVVLRLSGSRQLSRSAQPSVRPAPDAAELEVVGVGLADLPLRGAARRPCRGLRSRSA